MATRGSRATPLPDLQLSLPLLAAEAPVAVTVASAGEEPPPPVLQPHPLHRLLRHPRSNRDVCLGGQPVGYELRRARRRTIGFVVGDEGLAVSAPRWVPQAEIDSALQGKARFDTQYWLATLNPSDRYVLALPNSVTFRLGTQGAGFTNLYLAGDYLKTGMNVGCVEAATMGGMHASRAICGRPAEIIGDNT